MTRDYSMDILRTLAVLMVVLLHSAAQFVIDNINNNHFGIDFWSANIYDSLARAAVPIFVLISGNFLIADDISPITFYRKRLKRIFLPMFFWSVIFIGFSILVENNNYWHILSLLTGEPYYHLWYLYMLIGLYAAVPLVIYARQKMQFKDFHQLGIIFLLAGFLSNTASAYFHYQLIWPLQFINYLGYFILGYTVPKILVNKYYRSMYFNILPLMFLFLATALTAVLTYYTARYWGGSIYFYSYLAPTTIIAALAIYIYFSTHILKPNFFSRLSQYSFGIYLIHPLILQILFNIFNKKISGSIYLDIPLFTFICLILSWLMIILLNKLKIFRLFF